MVDRGTSNRGTRAASLGLAVVVVCLAAFSIFAAYTTQTQVDRAQRLESLHASYDSAISAIRGEKTAELEYHLDPSATHRAELTDSHRALDDAINQIAAEHGPADEQLVIDMRALHERYLEAAGQLIAAIVVSDSAEAQRIDLEETDPILDRMFDRITEASIEPAAQAQLAFATLRSTAQWTLTLAPVVFALGFALLLALWRILEQSNNATRKTYREIEQLSKLRSEFVSIVSHEFRTPLTGIQGFSEMIRDENLTLPEIREYAGDINKDSRRLARLITDMLDLDRMESGRMTLNSEPVDLNRIVAETAAQFRLRSADHPIELRLDAGLQSLLGDSDRLTQVVTNLISNAIKYSPSGGAVELRTERAGTTATLTVTDHGMGIPTEQLEKIFERYSRVETAETRGIQGIGLGLPIVRQIVLLSRGKVWATSESGQGSVFHVQLPLLEARSPVPLAA